ncbi:RHS repeat-associated protein [Actinomycetospora succinea]|uniref:RHS repeat-associated protein n=1 Tax=Actinomycetospora succinea TaxID=663603 RepID=A0A4R6VP95_9PSEU|nr:polymorphic toxin type 17 domain-containing protein [Actinomycetospora succinea]TDQ61235.1 RHS repeat-associated protein [Actinomycetospora succinea]
MTEAALGATTDPRELVGGDPAALTERAGRLRRFADHLGAAADGLERIDLRQWTGQAAEQFRARFGETPRGWRDAATAFDRASRALGDFAGAVTLAQQRAGEAIDVHARALAASEAARADYSRRVDVHNVAVAGGQAPPAMEPFADPATGDLARAEQLLADARRGRDDAAARVAGEVRGAGELTAPPPSTVAQLGANVADTLGVAGTVEDRFLAGVGRGAEGLVQFGRTINPLDPYNLTHPAQAGANLSSTGAGLVRAVAHPTELVKGAVGTGWGSDPAGALGELVPNAALTAATGGGGAAGRLGKLARAAGRSENRPLERLATRADPVDVVSGAQILTQVDLAIDAPLPLVLTRTHVSSWELGRHFGPRWASTLDQRLEFVGGAVWFVREDAVVVVYPAPAAEEAVLPAAPDHAPRWALARDGPGWVLTDPASGLEHTFAASGALTGWSVPGGDHVAVDRDDAGRPTAVRHSGGHHVEVATDPAGLVTAFRVGSPVVTFAHVDGQLAEVVNSSGLPLRFGYDASGRMTSWTDRNGVVFRSRYDERGRCVAGSADGGEMAWTFRYGRGVTASTDALGHTERFEHDARGRIVRTVDQLGAVTRSVWGDGDRLLARTDALGGTTRWVHDDTGRVVRVQHPDGSAEHVERDTVGNVLAVVDGAGATTRWERDDAARLVAVTDPTGATTRWERDGAGHVVAVVDPLGARTVVENDAAGRPLAVTDPTGAVTRVERDVFGRVVGRTDPLGARTSYAWTVEGLRAGRTAPDGATWAHEHDGEGNEVSVRDPVGAETRREYGAFDVVTAVVAADGARTEIVRDPLRRVVGVRDAGGRTWRTTYDPAGRVVAETDYEGRAVTLDRDALGRVVRRRNASGQEVRYEYDACGRVTTRWLDGEPERFGWDAAGRLVSASSPGASLRIDRDAAGRVVAESVDGRTVGLERDAAGRVVGRRVPSGAASRWTLDAVGRPAALEIGGQRMTFAVDAAGRETARAVGAASITRSFDERGRLVDQRLGGGPRRTWTYRADDHLVGVDDPDGSRRYELDPAGRVTAVGDERYRYDPAGTLVASGIGEPHVLDGTRVRRAGSLVVRRDADGRVVLRQRRRLGARPLTWHFTWDALDRLIGVTTPDGARWRYRYDVLGRRVAKERLGDDGQVLEQVHVAWDGTVVAEVAGAAGTTVWEWEPGTHRPLAQLTRTLTDDEVDERFHAIVTDIVGTPTELVAPDGEVVGAARASLWGRTVWTGASTPLRFPGQYHDDESGLAYNLHRYYDPDTGQYASPDPLGLAPSPHPYNYVPNPTAEIDPLGLQGCEGKKHTYRGRYREAGPGTEVGLPDEGLRFVPHRGWTSDQPFRRGPSNGYIDRHGNEWVPGPSRTAGEPFEWDVQLSAIGREHFGHLSPDGRHLNVSLRGRITH